MLAAACASKPPAPAQGAAATAESAKPIAGGDADGGGAPGSGDGSGGAPVAAADASAGPAASAAPAADASGTRGEIRSDDGDDACAFAAAAFEKRARPAIKACYREGRKKDANLVGGVRIVVNVAGNGKVGSVITSPNGDKALLPKPVVACMADAVKKTDPGDTGKCKSKTLVIPIQFPTQ